MIRTFLALPLEIHTSLTNVAGVLKDKFSHEKLRWVKEENMHLTIKFFGDIEEEQVSEIGEALKSAFAGFPSGEIRIRGLGTFENWSNYNVLWAGIEDPEVLVEIKNMADEALKLILPVQTQRHYRPHLTLARMKKLHNKEKFLEEIAKYKEENFGIYNVNRLVLFQSILGEQGPGYNELKELVLY